MAAAAIQKLGTPTSTTPGTSYLLVDRWNTLAYQSLAMRSIVGVAVHLARVAVNTRRVC